MLQSSTHTHALTCLIIEDNPGDFVLVEDFLIEKYTSVEILQGKDFNTSASEIIANRSRLSVIFLDIHLPDLSGVDLIKNVLKLADTIPVIILTGYADISIARLSLQMGVYDFLVKDELNASLLQKSVEFAINRKYFISQLDKEREKFENLFHFSPQPTWLLDANTLDILDANYSALQKYGYSLDEKKAINFQKLHNESEWPAIRDSLSSWSSEFSERSFTHYVKDGDEIKVQLHCKGVELEMNRKAIIVQANDISKTLQYIETIELQNEKLRSIAWTQSHEVRAPLARLLGIIHLIEESGQDLPDLGFWLSQLKCSSEEMDQLVRKIVQEAGNIDMEV